MIRLLLMTALSAAPLLAVSTALADDSRSTSSVLDHTVKDIDGNTVDLSTYKGDVLLIVNTASYCGYTPQYEGLETLYQTYGDRGFKVLAFPANEFGAQEPGTNAEIKAFCAENYDVSFPMFSKIVVKGAGIHPLYQHLTSKETNPEHGGDIKWNFTKFLVDRQGNVIARFEPAVTPQSAAVVGAIEKALAAESK